jgi:GAF domain-containing protein
VIARREPVLDGGSITSFLEHLTLAGAKLLADDDSVACGVMFKRSDRHTLFCSASPLVTDLYRALDAQHARGDGPAPQALTASKVQVADDTSDPAHPPFFRVPASLGFASILSVPLQIEAEGVAALNFYAQSVAFFTPDRQRMSTIFAKQAATALALRLHLTRYQELTTNMASAMESRTSIDLAIGIIIGQNHCSQQEAAAILKRASTARNVKLRDLAEDLVVHSSGGVPTTHFTP